MENNNPPTQFSGGVIPIKKIQGQKNISSIRDEKEDVLKDKTQKASYVERQRSLFAVIFFFVIILNMITQVYVVPKYKKLLDKEALFSYQHSLINKVSADILPQKTKLKELTEKSKSVILADNDLNTYFITNLLKDKFLSNRIQYPSNTNLSQTNDAIQSSIVFTATKDSGMKIIADLGKQNWLSDRWSFAPVNDASSMGSIPLYNFQINILIPIAKK